MPLLEKKPLEKKLHELYSTPSIQKRVDVERVIRVKGSKDLKMVVNPNMTVSELCLHPKRDEIHARIKEWVSKGLQEDNANASVQQGFISEADALWAAAKGEHALQLSRGGVKAMLAANVTKEDLNTKVRAVELREKSTAIASVVTKQFKLDDAGKRGEVHHTINNAIFKFAKGDGEVTSKEVADAVYTDVGKVLLDQARRGVLHGYVVKAIVDALSKK
jgi:hypothetical protein